MIKILLALLVIAVIYLAVLRPWIMHMGANPDEIKMSMPGDGLVVDANFRYTQAITIKAAPELVWAYLIQVGYHRAGWYNWDAINRLAGKNYFYENNCSAQRIIPELQNLQTGDSIYLTPEIEMAVELLESAQVLELTGKDEGRYLVTWTYLLKKTELGSTRLLVRWNSHLGEGMGFKLLSLFLIEPGGAGVQQSLMLRGIKKRAESDSLMSKSVQ